LWKFV
jgi:hypothetical protein